MRFLLTLALGLILTLGVQAQTATRALRPGYSRGAMALEVNGTVMGMVRSVSGGTAYGEVITEQNGGNRAAGKRVGAVRYEPITVELGMDMVPQFWELMRQWPANTRPVNGAVIFADVNYRQVKRMEFANALITEIELPALNAAEGKTPFTLLVTLQPEKVESRPGRGTLAGPSSKAKQAFCSNFRVIADGVDLTRVSKIESLSIKQQVATGGNGIQRRFETQIIGQEYSDLVLTLPEASSASLDSWFQDAVIKGSGKERDVRLELLDATLKGVVFAVNLKGVGIWKLGASEQAGSTQQVATVEAHFYVESAVLEIK